MNKNFLTFLSASTFLIAANAHAGKTPGEWSDAVTGKTLGRLNQEKTSEEVENWLNEMNQKLHARAQSLELLHKQLRTFFAEITLDDESYRDLSQEIISFWKTKATKARDAEQRFTKSEGTGKIETLDEGLMQSNLKMGRYIALVREIEKLEAQLKAPASEEEKGKEKEKESEGNTDISQKLLHAKEDLQRYAFLKFLSYANQFAAIPSSSSVNYHGFESYPEALPGEYFPVITKVKIAPAAMKDENISKTLSTIPTPANIIKTKMIKWAQRVTDGPWDAKFPVQSLIALAQDESMIQCLPFALSMKDLKAALPDHGVPQSKFQQALIRDEEKSIRTKPEGDFEVKLASANEKEKGEILEKALLKMVSYANLSYFESAYFVEEPTQEVQRDSFKAGKALKWGDRLQKHGQELIKKLGLKSHIFYRFNGQNK